MIARRWSASKYFGLDASTCRHRCSASPIWPRWIAATARCMACGTVKEVTERVVRSESPQIESLDQFLRPDLVPFVAEGRAKSRVVLHVLHRRAGHDAAFLCVLAGELGRDGRPDTSGAAHPGKQRIDVARGKNPEILVIADPHVIV